MTESQVSRWRELPSTVAARVGDETVESGLDGVAAEPDADGQAVMIAGYLDGLGR